MKDMRKWEQKKVLQVFLCWWNNADIEEDLYLLSCHLILSGFIDKERWRQKQKVRSERRKERDRERWRKLQVRQQTLRKIKNRLLHLCGVSVMSLCIIARLLRLFHYKMFPLMCYRCSCQFIFLFSQLQFIPHTFHSLIDLNHNHLKFILFRKSQQKQKQI